MTNFKQQIRNFTNSNRIIRPIKWKLIDWYFKFIFDLIKKKKKKKVVQIFGLQRTGNHAIIKWYIKNYKGTLLFCNDVQKNDIARNSIFKSFKLKLKNTLLLVSFEEYMPEENKISPSQYGSFSSLENILLLRDPFNLFASRYVWKFPQGELFRTNKEYQKSIVELWKNNARLFLKWEKENNQKNQVINYNKWCVDEKYRLKLINKFALFKSNKNIDTIQDFGGGSSFTGISKKVNKEDFSQRFLTLIHDESFKSIFQDKEIIELSNKIFGKIDSEEKLYN